MSVAVVGAGVAGTATAIGLAKLGLQVTLFEAVAEPQPIGAGLLLQPTGQRVLSDLGLLAPALAHGARLDRLLGDTAKGREVLNMRYSRFSAGAFGLGLQRGTLMGLLWQAARDAGVDWRCGVCIERLTQDAGKVQLEDADGRSLGPFEAVLVADGSFSRLRSHLGWARKAQTFPFGALWTVLPHGPGMPEVELRQRFRGAGQMLGLMPVGRAWGSAPDSVSGINLFWSLPLAEMPDLQQLNLARWKEPLLRLMPEVEPLLAGLTDAQQLRPARYADVRLHTQHQGRVLMLGDSAHGMSPQLGQGANMALIDAHVLARCWRTAAGAGPKTDWSAVFASFTRSRAAHLRFYAQASRALTPLFQSHQRVLPWLRDQFMGPLGRVPWFHGQNVATLSGMKTGWLWGQLDLGPNPWRSP